MTVCTQRLKTKSETRLPTAAMFNVTTFLFERIPLPTAWGIWEKFASQTAIKLIESSFYFANFALASRDKKLFARNADSYP